MDEGVPYPESSSNSDKVGMTIMSNIGNITVWSQFGPKSTSIPLDTGALCYQVRLQFYSSLPLHVNLQKNKVSEILTCPNASVLKARWKAST